MGRNAYKANQRILFSLLRGGVGVGVGTREPEGSLVKICSKIVETLLTLVIRLRFFPRRGGISQSKPGSLGLMGVEASLRGNSSPRALK